MTRPRMAGSGSSCRVALAVAMKPMRGRAHEHDAATSGQQPGSGPAPRRAISAAEDQGQITGSSRGVGRARWAATRPPTTAPTPMARGEQRVGAGPAVEGDLGQQGQGDGEVVGEDADDGHGRRACCAAPGCARRSGSPRGSGPWPAPPAGRRVELGGAHHGQADEHGHVGGGVHEEADAQPDESDDHAADGRARPPGGVHDHAC